MKQKNLVKAYHSVKLVFRLKQFKHFNSFNYNKNVLVFGKNRPQQYENTNYTHLV